MGQMNESCSDNDTGRYVKLEHSEKKETELTKNERKKQKTEKKA